MAQTANNTHFMHTELRNQAKLGLEDINPIQTVNIAAFFQIGRWVQKVNLR
jgi:hypothetical protein